MLRIILFLLIVLPIANFPQPPGKVEVTPRILLGDLEKKCEELQLGKLVLYHEPKFPVDLFGGYFGGDVEVNGRLDSTGSIEQIEKISGSAAFFEIAEASARKIKFSSTSCDGVDVPATFWINYRFHASKIVDNYRIPIDSLEILDLDSSSFAPVVLDLQKNFGLIHLFPDGKFYELAPLRRGEFAQFLQMTLDLLSARTEAAGKVSAASEIFRGYNPKNLKNVSQISGLDRTQPYFKASGILLQKYDISLADSENRFHGGEDLTNVEVVEVWTNIFGKDAVPVNFQPRNGDDIPITRGEFALFLSESLQVLTYKTLK